MVTNILRKKTETLKVPVLFKQHQITTLPVSVKIKFEYIYLNPLPESSSAN